MPGVQAAGEPAAAWATAAAQAEVAIVKAEGTSPLRYRTHKVDAKGDTVREVMETQQGSVARLVERDGAPLTAAEDAAEQERLRAAAANPTEFLRHHRRDEANRQYSLQLIALMPSAMLYSYAPGQPQLPHQGGSQVVLDFVPNPKFQPPTMVADLLTGLEGRIWIDRDAKRMVRVEARVLHPVNLGWGFVAKIYPGGTVELEQQHVAGDLWAYSHLKQHIVLRALMVKTQTEETELTSTDFRPLPAALPYQDAIRMLLAMRVPTRQAAASGGGR